MAVRATVLATSLSAVTVAGLCLSAATPAAAEPAPAAAANPCDIGALCVYEDAEFGGKHFEHQGNQSNWLNTSAPSQLRNKDSSWANRYQSWYWSCVYDRPGYVAVTVWVSRGQYLPRAGSGMYVNRGESHHGWNAGVSC
ncbi:hypothetical protein DPM19_19310 [Actinomadura craniellae]|uniref:Peptidase inhibitor family I36 protein n=1 Tax=Actinomadura craniellae TaxID=2231787 RepID=A0A365H485_9ACTN|nr:hypothetical protein DPM19_19310 [Actinomadura craniellae]